MIRVVNFVVNLNQQNGNALCFRAGDLPT